MNIKPIGDRILIEIEVKPKMEKTSVGLLIPAEKGDDGKTQRAVVLEIGDDPNITIKKGDRIIYDKYAGTAFSEEGKFYLILKQDDIIAKIE